PAAESGGGKGALVIVESPTKSQTSGKYLGSGYTVKATVGHLRDLPQRKLGVDVENGFTPEYVTIKEKAKTLAEIKKAAKASERVLLATDPDREGEAIAWHVASQPGNGGGGRPPARRTPSGARGGCTSSTGKSRRSRTRRPRGRSSRTRSSSRSRSPRSRRASGGARRPRRSAPAHCSRKRPSSWASPRLSPCASPSSCTKASRSGRRARSG